MSNNLYICKKDIWFNPRPDISQSDNILFRNFIYNISKELGFEKKYDTSVLVFKKDKVYKAYNHLLGVIVYSDIVNDKYYFEYQTRNKYLYFYSAFLEFKWQRKLKIKKLLKNL